MEGLEADPGTLRDSEEFGARRAAPASDIRGLAGVFLIVDGTGMFERLPCGSLGGCITERRLESILTGVGGVNLVREPANNLESCHCQKD